MATGLIALLDDVATLARVAAATLDDVGAQAMKAGAKAAGVVIDDGAVTPQYVVGFAADREVPIVARIATGSLRNKLLILLPVALLLSQFAPWAITPLLTFGGLFLCYEGAEKVYEALFPHAAHDHEAEIHGIEPDAPVDAKLLEDQQVAGAIKTDFILSAEIMAIALAEIVGRSMWMTAFVLAAVAIGITVLVYGAVALIVKADDYGVHLVRNSSASLAGSLPRALGHGLVAGMPVLLRLLGIVGTAAMIWVGGGIVVHGLAYAGWHGVEHAIAHAAQWSAQAVPAMAGGVHWLVTAIGSGLLGLVVGVVLIPIVGKLVAPLWLWLRALTGRGHATA